MNIYTVSFLLILILNLIKNRRSLTMLQKNLYNENNRYLKWVFKNWKTIFVSLDFISFIFLLLAYILDNDLSSIFKIATPSLGKLSINSNLVSKIF